MRFRRKAAALLAFGAASTLVLSACAGSSSNNSGSSKAGKSSGSLIYGADQFPENWEPQINAGNGTATANGIVRILPNPFLVNPKFQIVPDLTLLTQAPKVVKQKPFTVEFKINPKAVWSDGKPIDAEDFKYDWLVNNPMGAYGAGKLGAKAACQTIEPNYNLIKSVTGGTAKTVDYVYGQPFADWQSLPATGLMPSHIMEKSTPAATCAAFNVGYGATKVLPFSGGPWMMSQVNQTQQTFTLIPNKKYWGKKPGLAKLIYKVVPTDSNSLANGLQNNETQMIYPQPQLDLLSKLKSVTSAKTEVNFGLSFEHIDFNTTNPYLKDKSVREAIALALDRKEIVAKTVGQFDPRAQVLNNRIFVNNQKGYKDNAPKQYDKPNLAKAKSLLQSAGYTLSGGKLTKGGKSVSLVMSTTTNNALRADTEQVVQSELKPLGISLTLKQVDANTYFGSYTTPGSLNAGDCDLCLYAWVATPFLTSNYSIYHSVPTVKGKPDRSQEQQNSGLGADPNVDKLMDKARTETSPDQAIADWNQVDSYLWDDMYTLPLFQKPTAIAYSSKFHGIADNATSQGPLWNSDSWTEK